MLDWKTTAKHYRAVATEAMRAYQLESELRHEEEKVVVAARSYVQDLLAPSNPFVKLVTGQSAGSQETQKILIEAVKELEKFIQTYSQNTEQNVSAENLDNTPSV
jgi:UDP-N-acetylglucosamine:LPS N-acetylglucosamine transferase